MLGSYEMIIGLSGVNIGAITSVTYIYTAINTAITTIASTSTTIDDNTPLILTIPLQDTAGATGQRWLHDLSLEFTDETHSRTICMDLVMTT